MYRMPERILHKCSDFFGVHRIDAVCFVRQWAARPIFDTFRSHRFIQIRQAFECKIKLFLVKSGASFVRCAAWLTRN